MAKRNQAFIGIVQEVIDGPHGKYAVARSDQLEGGSVTFSLDKSVWKEVAEPECGSKVELSDIRGKAAGWRAHNAKFVRPPGKKA
ncbi:MAG: hypothetical protein G01um101420_428 [Parcubacteria group bacterium Gr01-1014_20]|nr:MAG: hypothetical protein G01um101420_428 [Parcubacteria group bacterium Gr01-1014_20]